MNREKQNGKTVKLALSLTGAIMATTEVFKIREIKESRAAPENYSVDWQQAH